MAENQNKLTIGFNFENEFGDKFSATTTAQVFNDLGETDIEFIELNFIDVVRNDTDIDNIDYVVDMMDALTKLRQTRSAMQKEIYQSVMKENV